MTKRIGHIIGLCFLFLHQMANAQTGFYIPKTAKIFFIGDTATIFSDVTNEGVFGIGRKAFVNFAGTTWENDPQSLIVDESYVPGPGFFAAPPARWLRFMATDTRQIIKGGYNAATKTGPAFFSIDFQNPNGVELSESSLKIMNTIKLTKGLVYLNSTILALGSSDPGIITGYDSTRFFVTNNKPGGGYLLRENISKGYGRVDFPIGSNENAYTPIAVKSSSVTGDDYFATVFDTVKTYVYYGIDISSKSVNKTWELGKMNFPGVSQDEIFLQHINSDEGNYFSPNRQKTYVSQNNGYGWDVGVPQLLPDSGYITTGKTIKNSGVNKRIFNNSISNSSFFTKFIGNGNINVQTRLSLTGWRVNKDLVHLNWNTQPEVTVKYFIVQRMLANENNYSNRDTVLSQVPNSINSISYTLHNYDKGDLNSYINTSFYRLKVVNLDSSFFYSNIAAVDGNPEKPLNLLWPNPTQNIFWVRCDPIWKIESIVIWSAIGQKIRQVATNGRTVIQMDALPGIGTYFVAFVKEDGKIVETQKLIVAGK